MILARRLGRRPGLEEFLAIREASQMRIRRRSLSVRAVSGTVVTRAHGPRQEADVVADAIVRAIAHPVPEVFPHFTSRALVWLNTFAPGICDRVVKRFGRKPIRKLSKGSNCCRKPKHLPKMPVAWSPSVATYTRLAGKSFGT